MEAVQNAIAHGREVTISERPITANGWRGAGYIITDPASGAGSYLIEGGANGAIAAALLLAILSVAMAPFLPPPYNIIALYFSITGFFELLEEMERIGGITDPQRQLNEAEEQLFLGMISFFNRARLYRGTGPGGFALYAIVEAVVQAGEEFAREW